MATIDERATLSRKSSRPFMRSRLWTEAARAKSRANQSQRRADRLVSQQLAAIVEGSDDAIVAKNLDGTVISWNASATRIFGYTAEEMIGNSIMRIVPADLIDEEAKILRTLAEGKRVDHFDTIRLAKNGDQINVSLTVSPLRDESGAIVGASKIARDISKRKQVLNELSRSNEALREALQMADQLRVEAENANRAKTDFLAVMSHEIRTPLNSIKGFIDLLTNATALTPQQRRYAVLVKTATSALMTVVNDILDFEKVESGKLDLDPIRFSLQTLVRDTAAIVTPIVDEKKLGLTVTIDQSLPEWIMGDHGRLRQVLLNLLNNAVKFTDAGSIHVEVRPHLMKDQRELIYFSVTDTGVGVAIDRQDRLFKQFSQADSSVTRRHGGTGLGLAICKRYVDLMGGEIGINSEVGRGSTVWFTADLPCCAETAPAPDIAACEKFPQTAGGAQPRILVVDDIDANLEIVEAYLEDCGYHVECASNALDAIQMLSSTKFDLILMDIQMPIMDGVTATRRIRAMPAVIRNIPIIAMTGNVLPQQVKSFLAAGMNDHVAKPIDRIKLSHNIRRWLPTPTNDDGNVTKIFSNFDPNAFDEFVLLVGDDKARSIVDKFNENLSNSFSSSLVEAQREAHGLYNIAGILGLEGLVTACRQIEAIAPTESERGGEAMKELQRARLIALQLLSKTLLPKLCSEQALAMSMSA